MIDFFSDLKTKYVINIKNGSNLGKVCDLEIDILKNCIKSIICKKSSFFNLFSKKYNITINWCNIEKIGEDTILVCIDDEISNCCDRPNFFDKIFN